MLYSISNIQPRINPYIIFCLFSQTPPPPSPPVMRPPDVHLRQRLLVLRGAPGRRLGAVRVNECIRLHAHTAVAPSIGFMATHRRLATADLLAFCEYIGSMKGFEGEKRGFRGTGRRILGRIRCKRDRGMYRIGKMVNIINIDN